MTWARGRCRAVYSLTEERIGEEGYRYTVLRDGVAVLERFLGTGRDWEVVMVGSEKSVRLVYENMVGYLTRKYGASLEVIGDG